MSLKSYLQLLLNRFINVSEKPNLGTLDLSRMVVHNLECNVTNQYVTAQLIVPFSGFVIFAAPFNTADCSIRKHGWGDYARTGVLGDSNARWQTLNAQVKKGESMIFDAYPITTGTALIKFIPYANT